MHMADALISPSIGGGMWAVSAGMIWYCSQKIKENLDGSKIPLMGVLGAFVFAAQMINFTIPGTGSSGHLGGGMLLAILLGPHAAFVTIASILTIQAFFFADGGLLALGCNIVNLGLYPCFIAYPFIYKKITGSSSSPTLITIGALIASVVGLQLGAFSVVMQTWLSGISELPLDLFLILMQPIHLAIGLVEGVVTAVVVIFIWKARPDIFADGDQTKRDRGISLKKLMAILGVVTIVTAGSISWFASSQPDGLEWSITKSSGIEELAAPDSGIYNFLANLQSTVARLPDYQFGHRESSETDELETWPVVDAGNSAAGLIGSGLTLLIVISIGFFLRRKKSKI